MGIKSGRGSISEDSMRVFGLVFLVSFAASSFAGQIIANNDEWTLSNAGFAAAGSANATTIAQNSARFMTGASGGAAIWIDSNNFGLDQNMLATALGGYTLTDTATFSDFTLATLQNYKAVFLGGDALTAADEAALVAYVNAGGGVYIAAGTASFGSAAVEAAQWNTVLNPFGLTMASAYNGVAGTIATSGQAPVLTGVAQLFYNNGNSVSVTGSNPNAAIITSSGNNGLIGIVSSVPEPGSLALAGLTLLGVGSLLRRSRR
jgi:hypothetical protein